MIKNADGIYFLPTMSFRDMSDPSANRDFYDPEDLREYSESLGVSWDDSYSAPGFFYMGGNKFLFTVDEPAMLDLSRILPPGTKAYICEISDKERHALAELPGGGEDAFSITRCGRTWLERKFIQDIGPLPYGRLKAIKDAPAIR
jgi:hypothetical protein